MFAGKIYWHGSLERSWLLLGSMHLLFLLTGTSVTAGRLCKCSVPKMMLW